MWTVFKFTLLPLLIQLMSREYEKKFVFYHALKFRKVLPSTVSLCGIFFFCKGGEEKSQELCLILCC